MKQTDFRDIISGRRKGISAMLLRLGLHTAGIPYSLAIRMRNTFYNHHISKTQSVRAAVISIGNITTGGTGKTPLVAWLAIHLSSKNRCAILTRGYKAATSMVDEPAILAQSVPGTPVIVNADRVAGAQEAIQAGAEVLILDDGFQHRRLERDLDIIAVDAMCPFGYNKILPAGLLREPISSIKRADAIIITRADQIDKKQLEQIENTIKAVKPSLAIATAIHKPLCTRNNLEVESPPQQLRGKKVFVFCGIGNPQAFAATVKSLGADIVDTRFYDDHHSYSRTEIQQIARRASRMNADIVITTEKDFSKIDVVWLKDIGMDFYYLVIEMELLSGRSQITELIEKAIAGKITASA